MDQPTPHQSAAPDPSSDPAAESAPIDPAPESAALDHASADSAEPGPPEPLRPSARDDRVQARLAVVIDVRDPIVAWARGWVSREGRLPALLTARTLDYAVLTEHALFLVTTGFFSRSPRRRVYATRLSDISASRMVSPGGRRLRIITDEGPALRIELRASDRGRLFAAAVIASVPTESPRPAE